MVTLRFGALVVMLAAGVCMAGWWSGVMTGIAAGWRLGPTR
jgi:hypothetical protein